MKTIAWWLWATNGKSWDVMCGRLADLTESPAWGTHVYSRMRTQRMFFAKGTLLQDRVARLKQIRDKRRRRLTGRGSTILQLKHQ